MNGALAFVVVLRRTTRPGTAALGPGLKVEELTALKKGKVVLFIVKASLELPLTKMSTSQLAPARPVLSPSLGAIIEVV